MDSMLEVLKNNPYWIEHVREFSHWKEIDPIVDGFCDFCYSAMKPLPMWIKNVEDLEKAMLEEEKIFVLEMPYCSFSDYSGGTVERSNYKDIEDNYEGIEGLYTFTGGHGTQSMAFDLRTVYIDRIGEIEEIIRGLENYPVIDEGGLSDLEMEMENEQWESFGRSDFRDSLDKEFKDFLDDQEDVLSWYYGYLWDISDIPDDKYDALFREACEAANRYPIFEEGGTAWFYPDENAKAVSLDQFKALIGYDKIPLDMYPMRPTGQLILDLRHVLDTWACDIVHERGARIVSLLLDAIEGNQYSTAELVDLLKT